ncbi:family 16 glycosylhydrolase [Mangrovihabitans endophyticus]|uniref:Endo-1,3-beta-glucanase n=1 Tax=Mangrovihabitans endophyticus TaxID=1751298 RepID=A0A8J3C114_9ACTN|nr:family 16 glycosylhydrolase [Mangrovihabitans endophyticus]GGL01700.1 endo-1,3-beta-glucanase [Mangrovihabitans endophyticus]
MRKARITLAAAVVAATLTGGLAAASRSDTADAAIGGITWQDEFNGAAGAPIDGSKWKFDIGGSGWGNNELEYYTNSTSNVSQDGQGHLAITARKENPANYQCHYGRCEYTSGRILTQDKFTQAYGRFEARIKIPKGQGIWPAFWMLGSDIGSNPWPNSGEIDIMENVGKEPNTVYGTVHGPGYSGGSSIGGHKVAGSALGDAFHTYAVEWSPNLIVWFLDGQEYFRVTPASLNGNRWVFDHPFFMLLNVAVGGYWPGNPDASTVFPQTMLVDWVRVSAWNDGGGGGSTPPPSTGGTMLKSNFSGRCIDIPGGNAVDGARLQMYDCNGSDAQKWTFQGDGTLRAKGMCMDPAGGALSNGTPIQIVSCNGNPVQRFTLSGAGDLVNVSANRCVDVKDWNSGNGAQLQLWDCGGTSNQKWTKA